MERVKYADMSQLIGDIHAGKHQYADIEQVTKKDDYDLALHFWYIDGKKERFAILSSILERSINRVYTKRSERKPYGLSRKDRQSGLYIPETGIQSFTQLGTAMLTTLTEGIDEELASLESQRTRLPDTPAAQEYQQFLDYCQFFNKHFDPFMVPVEPREVLIHGATTGVNFMTGYLEVIPKVHSLQTKNRANDAQAYRTIARNTFSSAPFTRLASDMVSFRTIRRGIHDQKKDALKPQAFHLKGKGNSMIMAINEDILNERKKELQYRKQHPERFQRIDESKLAVACPVVHTEDPVAGIPGMDIMTAWYTEIADELYPRLYPSLPTSDVDL